MTIPRKPDERGTPIHPGEFLRDDFLAPLNLSANALAIALRVPVTRISEIVRERRGITADTALRLARYFGTTPDFWMKMQMAYDLAVASRDSVTRIEMEIRPAREARIRKGSPDSSRKQGLRFHSAEGDGNLQSAKNAMSNTTRN